MSTEFWKNVKERVRNGDCDFHGERFPSDPCGNAFRGMDFTVAANFRDAEFDDNIDFEHVTFHDRADFSGAKFNRSAFFAGSTFRDCDFCGAEIRGYARFIGACFEGEARFQSTIFHKDAFFDGATFKLGVGFWEAEFRESVSFSQAVFEMWLTIATARVNATMAFSLPSDNTPPFRYATVGEDAYRLAKRAAERSGDYRIAGEYHFAEQCAIGVKKRKAAREFWKDKKRWQSFKAFFRGYADLLVGQWLFGYGERLLRPLIAGGVLILLWAIFYSIGGIVCTPDNGANRISHSFMDSLYFSIVTFTTLGYGDLLPSSIFVRALACAEALAGVALMALFVVSLARRFTR